MNPKLALSSNVSYVAEECKKKIVFVSEHSEPLKPSDFDVLLEKRKAPVELSLKQKEQCQSYGK
jgi:hypothetical protein